jgi:glycosyltransferase involved in cell wall biosynthesis
MARLRQEFPFDLIDAHFAYPDGLAAVLLGKLFRVPVMITLRGSIVRLSQYPIHRPQLRWTLRHAAGIAAVSQSLRQEAVTLGIRKDRIHVIPNGVDTDRFFPRDRQSARVACGLPSDRMVLLSVGGITEGKGQHLVMDAMSQLVASYPDLLYVMVGAERRGDPFRRCLERRIAAHKLQDHVYLAGQRPHTELPAWYASADLFCLATRSEGWANVLLESLACGIPVVTTNVGGNPEIIRENRDGILVIPGDSRRLATAIETALQRGWDREGMVAYARNHCWERAAEEVLKMFCSLLSQDSSGRRVALATDNLSGRCP